MDGGSGRRGKGSGGGARASVPGGVGGRDSGPRDVSNAYKKEEKWRFLKDGLRGGGGTHRSWPGGRGGRPRALGAGEGWGGVGAMANFAMCVVFLSFLTRTKRRKMAFFEGCPVGWGGYPPELAWWTGGVDQGRHGPQGRSKFRNVCCIFVVSKEEKWLFLKDALWGGGGVPIFEGWSVGWGVGGSKSREGVREGLAWRSGGCKGFGCGGVGVGARAPGTEQISQRVSFVVSNAYKNKKYGFF